MYITVDEFMLCAHAKGYENIKGFENWEETTDFNGYGRESFAKHLLSSGILEKKKTEDGNERQYIFSPLGQLYMEVMSSPDSWIRTENLSTGSQRYIYSKNFYFLSVDVQDNCLSILLLPTIQLLVGAYACTWPSLTMAAPLPEAEKSWEDGKLVYELSGESFTGKLHISVCDNGSARKAVDEEIEYSSFSEETYTNAVTQWFLKGITIQ